MAHALSTARLLTGGAVSLERVVVEKQLAILQDALTHHLPAHPKLEALRLR